MNFSAVMTLHDRDHELIANTLRSMYRSGMKDCEVVIVNDRSTYDYSGLKEGAEAMFDKCHWVDTGEYDGFRVNGYGNPAYAFNLGLQTAERENVVLMSSDVIVTKRAVERMKRFTSERHAWTPIVYDFELGFEREYCGPKRFFPMPWFLAAPRQACVDCGAWDESYLGGLCFEDNDFVGRLGLQIGTILGDWTCWVYHQSHDQPAYDFNDAEVKSANDRNRQLTMRKWAGIPFDGTLTPMDILRKPHESGCSSLLFQQDGLLDRLKGLASASV